MEHLKISEIIRKHRTAKGFTQMQLARILGHQTPQFVSLIERGQSKVPITTLGLLVVVLELPEEEIVELLIGIFLKKTVMQIESGKNLARRMYQRPKSSRANSVDQAPCDRS